MIKRTAGRLTISADAGMCYRTVIPIDCVEEMLPQIHEAVLMELQLLDAKVKRLQDKLTNYEPEDVA